MNLSHDFRPTECRKWCGSFGFLHNPELDDIRDVFCHVSKVPVRMGIGQRLMVGERVEIKFSSNRKGRLQVDELRFPDAPRDPETGARNTHHPTR